ncbi:MAG: MarR family transcriptional regulator [Acidimicrobiia bacterium]|nr:MarR family transcriptional regulator [Acidimicrobiia bacterium]
MTRTKRSYRQCSVLYARRLSRLLTARYDAALRPLDLRTTQFHLLAVVTDFQPISITQTAQILATERSTLSRNAEKLAERGLLSVEPGTGRERLLRMTDAGATLFDQGREVWRDVQSEVEALVGPDLMAAFEEVVERWVERLRE